MTEETVFLPQPSRAFIQAGTRLNDTYVVRSLIAAGGMGEVYKGEALGTGDAVAIKVIKHRFDHAGPLHTSHAHAPSGPRR